MTKAMLCKALHIVQSRVNKALKAKS